MPQIDDYVHPFAEVALSNITREYPYVSHHLARSLADIVPAVEKNPAFANSYDWHSSVHMHYLLASLLETELAQSADWRERALEVLSSHLSGENMFAEAAFLRENPSWERPYGWAWAVELNRVLNTSEVSQLSGLGTNTQVLADTVFDLASTWLPKVAAPVRHGGALEHGVRTAPNPRRGPGSEAAGCRRGHRRCGATILRRGCLLELHPGTKRSRLPLPRSVRGRSHGRGTYRRRVSDVAACVLVGAVA